jgi:hypothetical protein
VCLNTRIKITNTSNENQGEYKYMYSRAVTIDYLRNLLKVAVFMAFLAFVTGQVWAQSSSNARGEVVSARGTTINGFPAISGMTVFNDNRIRTGQQGAAIINLGRLGRIECGPETDITLRLSGSSIGGELRSNRLVVSARSGIAVAINTEKGTVITDGKQPAVLTIHVDSKRARAIAHLGSARIVSNGEERRVEGKELSQSSRGEGRRRDGFSGLFKSGINYSIDPKSDKDPDSEKPYETSMTCRNGDKKHCRKKSHYKPKKTW